MDLRLIDNSETRLAIRRNLISFPAQIPSLKKLPSHCLQNKLAQLYFVMGWTMDRIGRRYGLDKAEARRIINEWRVRAVTAGLIQEIYPEVLESQMDGTNDEAQPDMEDTTGTLSEMNHAGPSMLYATHPRRVARFQRSGSY